MSSMSSMTNEKRSLSFFYLLLINGFSLLWETTRVVWFLVCVLFGKKNGKEVLPLHDTWKHINLSFSNLSEERECVCALRSLSLSLHCNVETWNVCIWGVLDTLSFPFLSLTLFHHPSHLYKAFSLSLDVTRVRPIHRERELLYVHPSELEYLLCQSLSFHSMFDSCFLLPTSFPSSSSSSLPPSLFSSFAREHIQLLTSIIDFSSSSSLSQA